MIIDYCKQKLLTWCVVTIDLIIFRSTMINNNAKIDGNSNSKFYFFMLYKNI